MVITGVHATWISKGYILLSGSLITQAPWKTKFKSDVNGFQSSADRSSPYAHDLLTYPDMIEAQQWS